FLNIGASPTTSTNGVIPHGVGFGNVVIGLSSDTTSKETLNLNGFDTTINGLAHGVTDPASVANTFVENDAPNTLSTLTVGDYDQTATFGGIIRDAGPVSGGGGTLAI